MKGKRRTNPWRYFRVRIIGRNFQLAWRDNRGKARVRRMGFLTTVHVRARNLEEAELRAVNILRKDKALNASVRNPRSDLPRMFLDEIVELRSFKGYRIPRTGFTFYPERGPRAKRK